MKSTGSRRLGARTQGLLLCHLLLGLLVLLTSCGKAKKIEGHVVSESGEPLAGVRVQVAGTEFVATTDKSGRYSLDYAPGTLKVVYSQDGRYPDTTTVSIAQKAYFPAAEIQLLKVPPTPGVVWLSPKGYVPIPETAVLEEVVQAGRTIFDREVRKYLPGGAPTYISGRNFRFLDTSPLGLFLIRLSPEGRLATISYESYGLNSQVDAKEVPETRRRRSETCVERIVDLEPGDYAFTPFTGSMVSRPGGICHYFRVGADTSATSAGAGPTGAGGSTLVPASTAFPSVAGSWEWDAGEEGIARWVLRQEGAKVEGRYDWEDVAEASWAEVRGEIAADGTLTLVETKRGDGNKVSSPIARYKGRYDLQGSIVGEQSFSNSQWKNNWKLTRQAGGTQP